MELKFLRQEIDKLKSHKGTKSTDVEDQAGSENESEEDEEDDYIEDLPAAEL